MDRVKNKIEQELSEDEYGFRKGRGTREAIIGLRLVIENGNKSTINFSIIDIEKSFNRCNWELFNEILEIINIDDKDRMIKTLCERETT